ncbi:MAG: TonB-dependent receptor [Deltaproteobacteria bacterium]|nr:TonB-dependent receptor [Deltaproteobacteria bacterium]
MIRTLVVWVVIATAGSAAAAPRELRGIVTREGEIDPIAGATVLTDHGAIAVSDLDGFFTIVVDTGDRELTVAAPGYATRVVAITAGATLRIGLARVTGSEVIEVRDRAPEQTKPISYGLSVDEIRTIPGAGNDILRAAQVLPGVARIPYAFGGLVLRGMSPRDSAIYLDGIEVPIAFHFGGITSFYPSGMLANLTLTAGGFDASFGRAQGGLVTLATREPRTDRWRAGGSIGLFDSSAQAEGPLPGGGGILVGLRRSYLDRIAAPFVDDNIPLPSYWDYQIRTSWGDPRKGGRITPMIFGSIDRVASDEISVTSMFVRAAAPYLRQWGPITLRVVPWVGVNTLRFASEEGGRAQSFSRPEYPGGVRAEVVRDAAWGHVRAGAEVSSGYLSHTQVNFSGNGSDGSRTGDSTVAWSDFALWSELRLRVDGDRFAIKPGVRAEAYGLTGELVVDPRLNIHQRLAERLVLRQAIGRYHQPPTPGDVDPRDGNPSLDSSYIDQFSLGLDAELPQGIAASLTGFYHYGTRQGVAVRSPRPGSDLPEPNLGGLGPTFQLLLEKQLGFAIYRENLGRAKSFGLELSLKRNAGPLFTLLSYTFALSERVDDPRLGAGWRPFELDQRHNLQLAASYAFTKWRVGARLQVVAGNPYSPTRLENGGFVVDPWAGRLPAFVSLDLRADRRWHRCWGDIVFYIDVQNATNRYNVEGRDFGYDDVRNRPGDIDIPGLPIVPFLGVEFLPLR